MTNRKQIPIRYLITTAKEKKGPSIQLSIHQEIQLTAKHLRLRRVHIGPLFHTIDGAKAYARIHAGNQPVRFTDQSVKGAR